MLAVGLVAPWWFAATSPASVTFYKEWLAIVGVSFAGMLLAPGSGLRLALLRHPLVWSAAAILLALLVQCLVMPGTAAKAQLTAAGVAFFVVCIAIGQTLRQRAGNRSIATVALFVLVAALGACAFAAIQLVGLDDTVSFVATRVDGRLSGNVLQANHFADLLWLGAVAATWFAATRRLSLGLCIPPIFVLQAFSVFTGSRMTWIYAALIAASASALWLRGKDPALRRFAAALLILVASYGLIALVLNASGTVGRFAITSAEGRISDGIADESTNLRLWFWSTGVAAAVEHPLLGVGVGRFAGFARERLMATPHAPAKGADSQAHNLFIQLAAELGLPVAALVAGAVLYWLVLAVRSSWSDPDDIVAVVMAGVILVHANLEHPLAYLYFLAVLGVLIGHVRIRQAELPTASSSSQGLRIASFVMLALAVYGYVQFDPVDKATRIAVAEVRAGQPPHPNDELVRHLETVWIGSPYLDFAETVALMVSVPTSGSAAALSDRCERNVRVAPTPYLLARCATDLQVAGRASSATDFANSVCRIYPEYDRALAQSMAFVEETSSAAGDIRSTCVTRSR